jgi:N-acetylmuramoyl-L-alanine amidase CwlA
MDKKWIGCHPNNFRKGRPFGLHPEAIVIHIIDGSFAAGQSVFLDGTTQKSAHYAISRQGEVHQYVDENDTAFHAGIVVNPSWPLLKERINPNFYTVGIEHEGRPNDAWPDLQLRTSAALVAEIAARWSIPLDTLHVIRHHQIRASKSCPGNWVTIEKILQLAPSRMPLTPAVVSSVRLLKTTNLRAGRPTTDSPIVRVMPAESRISVTGVVSGQRVAGNGLWYVDGQGNLFWSGATDFPEPVMVQAAVR